ncbi:hypothetical protein [Microbacterium atlanticum]|uniref:hypothetical protein n=1 Tax=Microbacterium atlanticum TaxID=2782168 RepID=UPI001889AB67|nr:hypothetical protein [Microbacterium atlanticum]
MLSAESRAEVFARLSRGQEFLAMATIGEGDENFVNSVVSLCAQAGIAASDATLMAHGIGRGARAGHETAPAALRRIQQDRIAAALSRLLRLKAKAQYTARTSCTLGDARSALSDARRALELAKEFCERKVSE